MKEDLLQACCIRGRQFQLDVPNKLWSGHIHGPHDSGDLIFLSNHHEVDICEEV